MFNYRRFVTSWDINVQGESKKVVSTLPSGLNPVPGQGHVRSGSFLSLTVGT